MTCGRLSEARDLALSLLGQHGVPATVTARLRLRLVSILLMSGRSAEAMLEAEAVLQEDGVPDDLCVAADVDRATALTTLSDMAWARHCAEAILASPERPAGDPALAVSLSVLGLMAWSDGRLADALSLLTAAAQRVDQGPTALRGLHARLRIAPILTTLGLFDEADTTIEAARREVEGLDDHAWAAGPMTASAQVHLAAGRLDDAAGDATLGLEVSERLATRLFVPAAEWVLTSVALQRGDLDGAERHLRRGRDDVPDSSGGLSQGTYRWTEARVASARGEQGRAIDILREIVDQQRDHRRFLVDQPGAAGWLVRTAMATGDRARAEAVVQCVDHLASANPGLPAIEANAAHTRGLYDSDPGTLVQAAETFTHPWARASALEDAARTLAEHGDRRAAGPWLQEALATYRCSGADRDAARVGRIVHGLRRQRALGTRPVTGWGSLTDTERRVATTVAEGHTNAAAASRLYLSRHTVDFHLRQIFRKLAIRSRVQLTRIVVERGTGSHR
ncbi:MAG: LuxR C-terminal-related transcriptional regulator [Acidimicrobiales bacterium]